MNTYPKFRKPFAFWLVQQFLPVENIKERKYKPISDREFYASLYIIGGALTLFGIIIHSF